MEEPNLCRTQSRESKTSGLDRVRQAQRLDAKSEVRTVCVSSASTGPCGVVSRTRSLERDAVPEMKEDPSKPACRSRLQTTVSCCRPMAVVVNVTAKGVSTSRHVWVRETNASEPLMRPRNGSIDGIKTGAPPLSGKSMAETCLLAVRCPGYRWRDSSLGSGMELENLFGGGKGKGTSGSPARPKVPKRRIGTDRPVVAMKRSNVRGAKGAGHSRHDRLGQLATGGTDWLWRRAAALNGWHEPCDGRLSRTVL